MRKQVAIIGTGGTIAYEGRHPLDLYENEPGGRVLEVKDLISRFPQCAQEVELIGIPYRTISSDAIEPSHWLEINALVHRVAEEERGIHGIVITHGTATLEETAYFLSLSLKISLPVVVVGAQRPASALASDAPMNLLQAIRVAVAPEAHGLGVVTLLNDQIQAAREVTKTSTYRLEAFRSPEFGALGFVDPDGKVSIYRTPARRRTPDTEFDVRRLNELPRVEIVYSYAGASGDAINGIANSGAAGIVVACLLPGRVAPAQGVALAAAAQRGILVVLSARGGAGRVLERAVDRDKGYVTADNLSPQKARVLAMLALSVTNDRDAIRQMFLQY